MITCIVCEIDRWAEILLCRTWNKQILSTCFITLILHFLSLENCPHVPVGALQQASWPARGLQVRFPRTEHVVLRRLYRDAARTLAPAQRPRFSHPAPTAGHRKPLSRWPRKGRSLRLKERKMADWVDACATDDIEEEEDAADNWQLVTTGITYDDDFSQMLTMFTMNHFLLVFFVSIDYVMTWDQVFFIWWAAAQEEPLEFQWRGFEGDVVAYPCCRQGGVTKP